MTLHYISFFDFIARAKVLYIMSWNWRSQLEWCFGCSTGWKLVLQCRKLCKNKSLQQESVTTGVSIHVFMPLPLSCQFWFRFSLLRHLAQLICTCHVARDIWHDVVSFDESPLYWLCQFLRDTAVSRKMWVQSRSSCVIETLGGQNMFPLLDFFKD